MKYFIKMKISKYNGYIKIWKPLKGSRLENHLYKLPPIPIFGSLYKILSCDKESNAFSNSYTTLPIYVLCYSFKHFNIFVVIYFQEGKAMLDV